jgi:hypothetical protein
LGSSRADFDGLEGTAPAKSKTGQTHQNRPVSDPQGHLPKNPSHTRHTTDSEHNTERPLAPHNTTVPINSNIIRVPKPPHRSDLNLKCLAWSTWSLPEGKCKILNVVVGKLIWLFDTDSVPYLLLGNPEKLGLLKVCP